MFSGRKVGRGERIRTSDLTVPNDALNLPVFVFQQLTVTLVPGFRGCLGDFVPNLFPVLFPKSGVVFNIIYDMLGFR
jgi:hypothetical protein